MGSNNVAVGDGDGVAIDSGQSSEAQPHVDLLPSSTARVSETQSALITQIGDATKWLIAAIAAVATIVLAGIHLSNIASVHGDRLWIAIIITALSLIAVLLAIWRAALVLMPSSLTVSALSEPKSDKIRRRISADPVLANIDLRKLPGERDDARAKLAEQEREFDTAYENNDPLKAIYQDRLLRKRENAAAVDRTVEVVEVIARYYVTRRRFRQALWALAIAVVVVVAAAPVFVVDTSRATASQPVTSCRYATTAFSLNPGRADPPPCPAYGEPVIVAFTQTGRQAYERVASALNNATCTISKEVNPLAVVDADEPISVILLEVNGSREGPCITDQIFILNKNYGRIYKYPFTRP